MHKLSEAVWQQLWFLPKCRRMSYTRFAVVLILIDSMWHINVTSIMADTLLHNTSTQGDCRCYNNTAAAAGTLHCYSNETPLVVTEKTQSCSKLKPHLSPCETRYLPNIYAF
jgi:hypothetical protein